MSFFKQKSLENSVKNKDSSDFNLEEQINEDQSMSKVQKMCTISQTNVDLQTFIGRWWTLCEDEAG